MKKGFTNNAPSTFYLCLQQTGTGYMTENHTDNQMKPPAIIPWVTSSDKQQRIFYMHHCMDCITHTTTFVTPGHCWKGGMAY